MNPSLVVKGLDQILDVSDLLVVLSGSLLPFLKLLVVVLSNSEDSLNLRLDDGGPHILVELGDLLSLLEGDVHRVVSLVIDQLS